MKEEPLLLLSDLQKLINQVVLIDYTIIILGDDTLCGGEGNDYLSGNEGNDIYLFGRGYGSDTVEDSDGDNRVVLDELAPNKVTFQMKTNGNLVVSVKGSDDALIIKKFSSDLYIFEFANGVTGTVHADAEDFT